MPGGTENEGDRERHLGVGTGSERPLFQASIGEVLRSQEDPHISQCYPSQATGLSTSQATETGKSSIQSTPRSKVRTDESASTIELPAPAIPPEASQDRDPNQDTPESKVLLAAESAPELSSPILPPRENDRDTLPSQVLRRQGSASTTAISPIEPLSDPLQQAPSSPPLETSPEPDIVTLHSITPPPPSPRSGQQVYILSPRNTRHDRDDEIRPSHHARQIGVETPYGLLFSHEMATLPVQPSGERDGERGRGREREFSQLRVSKHRSPPPPKKHAWLEKVKSVFLCRH
ncbi:MAG: hypothetical protein M1820_008240 [Bogoriella megaspora]|nr:MAG: hypothetical protein M1820_008240 [Bogoriella megaspora]